MSGDPIWDDYTYLAATRKVVETKKLVRGNV